MKNFSEILCLFLVWMFFGCNETCRVEGKMSGIADGTTVYMLRRTGEFTFDTLMQTEMKAETFQLVLSQELWGEQYNLKFGNNRTMTSFFAEKGKVSIEGNGETIFSASAKGTPDNEIWNTYMEFERRMGTLRNQEMQKIRRSDEPDSIKRIKNDLLFTKFKEESTRYRDSLSRANTFSVAALYLYYQLLPMLEYNQIDSILKRFSPQLHNNRYYREMKAQADVLRKIAPGVLAPDFEVKTVDGGSVTLSSFRGKYLILDFWASWCAPCRQETIHIKELYNKYHDAGLEVFSVSLDHEKEAWLKAIKDDGMTWNHGCQLLRGGKTTPVAKLYGIDGIPAIWVIDPDGKILAEGLQGKKLIDFCEQLFIDVE